MPPTMSTSHPRSQRRRTRLGAALAAALLALAAPLAVAQDADPAPTEAVQSEPAPEPISTPAPAASARPLPTPRPVATPPAPPADPAADPADPAPSPPGHTPLGSEDGVDKASLEFTTFTAGIAAISLPDSYNSVGHESHIKLQQLVEINDIFAIPFALVSIEVNGDIVDMSSIAGAPRIWEETAPGVFTAHIDSPDGVPLLRVTRAYTLKAQDRYGFTVSTTLENLSDSPVTARVIQTGPIDLPPAENNYAGDKRRIRFGYMQPPELQLTDRTVTVDDDLAPRTDLLGKRITLPSGFKAYPGQHTVWPTPRAQERGHRLSWLAFTDRYFAVAVHPLFDPAQVSAPEDKLLDGLGPIDRLVLNPGAPGAETIMVVRFNGVPVTLAPGEADTHAFGVYAGPMSRPTIRNDALLASLRMPEMVVYNLGGFCAPCTFAWLTDALMGVLRLFHSFTGDWAIAIMLLVVLVRAVLHPVTRWSQIRMQKFGAQMQAMGPKQVKLKEKYKDDPKKLQQEMAKLWKEEGISPAGMLGCLPMFLQSPVWIALYATLFFAIELRQEPAFYGVFQTLTSGSWQFLADLAEPDHAIPLPQSWHFSFPLWGAVQAINILPLLLGVVFFAHQKFLTPPTSATMTPEQQQQQKIIKVMMVVMFPIMMYAAPSGLAIYFITNSVLGIFEHKWIRAHMDKHGLLDPEKIKAERQTKGPGFMSRLAEAAETQRKLQAQAHGGRPPVIPDKNRGKKKK